MNYKPILLVAGEPNSIFFEIYFKSIKSKEYSCPLILIGSYKLLLLQMKALKFKKKINLISLDCLKKKQLNNKSINLININYNKNKAFAKISKKSSKYIENSFKMAFKIIRAGITNKLINGPISKKHFLNKKFLGITEFLSKNFNSKNAMLIYNKELSVCPVTTHLPLKFVQKRIIKKTILDKIYLLNDFYIKQFKYKPKIGILGLNPHCESIDKFNEDEKIIKPSVKFLKNMNFKVSGPYSADTIFLKNNRKNFDIIVGMYHDQVLTPFKTLFEYDAINITLGLPFIRISPDHGPNENMIGKNISNSLSLIRAIEFLDKN